MDAVILAAGYGTRMYPLTKNMPKPLLEVGGKPVLNYLLSNLSSSPAKRAVIVTNGRFYPLFCRWAEENGESYPFPVEILNDGTTENESRLGAIGDLAFALKEAKIREDALISSSDNIFMFPLRELALLGKERNGCAVCVQQITDISRLRRTGVAVLDENMRIINFEEKPKNPKSNLAVPAVYYFTKRALTLVHEYLALGNNPDAPGHYIEWLHKKVAVYGYFAENPSLDIGTIESYRKIDRMIKDRKILIP